jgi:integrase
MTGSTYLDFDKAGSKGLKLVRTGDNPTFGLLIICGINLGLRIGDLLSLTYGQLRNKTIILHEQKTKKKRELKVNDNIRTAMEYFKEQPDNFHAFRSQKGSVYTPQHVNRLMKNYFNKNATSHSLRKTFGRRIWDKYNRSDEALILLSDTFNHTNTAITRRYLGIRREEINDMYDNL